MLDLDKNGTYEYDASAYLLEVPMIRRGRRSALDPMGVGEMTLKLNNTDGRWSPDKGTLTGLDEFVAVQLTRTWTTPAVTNLDDNPSAEVDATGASGISATVVRDTADSWVGGASFKTTTTNVTGSGIEKKKRDGSRFPVTAAQVYTWAPRAKCASAKNMKAQILWYNSGAALIQTDEGAFTFGSGWIQPTLTVTAPTGAVTAVVRLLTDGAQGVFDFWLDASFFYLGVTLLPYADGDQPGCIWAGTAHQSTSQRPANPQAQLFTGYIVGFDLGEDKLDQTATLTFHDRLTLLPQNEISLGNMLSKGTALVLHRLLDRVEGELISNSGVEDISWAVNLDGYSALAGAVLVHTLIPNSGSEDLFFEGDWVILITPDGAQALSGWRYNVTSQITALGAYRQVVYARSASGTVAVRFRYLRDTTVVATKTVTLTTSWQRIELDVIVSVLGTNRYIELVTDTASATAFRSDALHAVNYVNRIPRDFDAGTFTVPLLNAFHARAADLVQDVLRSEPGLLFAKKNGDIAFRDKNSRPATAIPKAVFGDGDGLLQFDDGLGYGLDAADRVGEVTVTSRGTPVLGSGRVAAWQLAPEHDVAVGDAFRAHYSQALRAVKLTEKDPSMATKNVNYGAGCDILMQSAVTNYYSIFEGLPYNYPSEESAVTVVADTGLPLVNKLSVAMPLQGTSSAAMGTEAQRLLDKYKNRVIILSLPLNNRNDEVTAWQMGLEINDQIIVRAKFKTHSPNIDKKFWVEGISHRLGKGSLLETVLYLEEA
ncbi:MAG: hypothetical protein A2V88_12330 [Elusimicrobia bacterium RBG_16_66_12]|nr:MAG: hypothetical protein A2V88_12330 [Elusimicrobia bacterium RBG_16_66_12]